MLSHLHTIISTKKTKNSLDGILLYFKKLSNGKLIEEINLVNERRSEWLIRVFAKAASKQKRIQSNKLWKDGNNPIELNSNEIL